MNLNTLFIALGIFFLFSFSQVTPKKRVISDVEEAGLKGPVKYYLDEFIYVYEGKDSVKKYTESFFNEKGMLTKKNWVNYRWKSNETSTYQYENDLLVSNIETDNKRGKVREWHYEHNKDGKLSKEIVIVEGSIKELEEYTYAYGPLLIKKSFRRFGNDTNLVKSGYVVDYVYDEKGRLVSEINSNNKVTDISYNKDDQVVMEETYTVYSGANGQRFKSGLEQKLYTYNGRGRVLTEALVKKWSYGEDKIYEYKSTYDAKDSLTKYEVFDKGKLRTAFTYAYDSLGRKFSEIKESYVREYSSEKIIYNYDSANNIVREDFFDEDGKSDGHVNRTFDKYGNMILQTNGEGDEFYMKLRKTIKYY